MRARVARIFDSLGRPRVGVRGQEAQAQLSLYRRRALLGAIGLAPALKTESPERKSGLSKPTTNGDRHEQQ